MRIKCLGAQKIDRYNPKSALLISDYNLNEIHDSKEILKILGLRELQKENNLNRKEFAYAIDHLSFIEKKMKILKINKVSYMNIEFGEHMPMIFDVEFQ